MTRSVGLPRLDDHDDGSGSKDPEALNPVVTPKKSTSCTRCGQCCLKGSPTLQSEDVRLLDEGHIQWSDLYTIRADEVVWDNIKEELKTTEEELIKIREKEDAGGCLFYDENSRSCRIYSHRPAQCRALSCWDTRQFMEVYARPKASRRTVIQDRIIFELIEAHRRRCAYRQVTEALARIEDEGEPALEALLEVLRFDEHIRSFVSRKLHVGRDRMDFLFGRPFSETIASYGLQVNKAEDGSFLLTIKDP